MVETGYLLKSYYYHTLPKLIPYCKDMILVCKKFVVDVTCTRVDIKYQ